MACDDELRDPQAVGLRADGVDLAVHLLQQEVELAAARLGAVGQRVPVRQVAAEARDLFADVRALRDPHHLLRQRRLIDRQRRAQLAGPLEQPRLDLRRGRRRRRRQSRSIEPAEQPPCATSRSARRCAPSRARISSSCVDGPRQHRLGRRGPHCAAVLSGRPLADRQRLRQPQQVARRQRAGDQSASRAPARARPSSARANASLSSTSAPGLPQSAATRCSSTRPRATRFCTQRAHAAARASASAGGSRSCRSRNRWLTARMRHADGAALVVVRGADANPVMLLIMRRCSSRAGDQLWTTPARSGRRVSRNCSRCSRA